MTTNPGTFEADLETLRALDPPGRKEFPKGRYALRLDLHFPAPVHKRPAKLAPILEQAAEIMDKDIAFYGSEGPFSASSGRKARASDIAQLAHADGLLRVTYEEEVKELAERRSHIEAHTGEPTFDHQFKAGDHGNLFLGDRLPLSDSDTHIQLNGTGAWAASFSFGLGLVAEKADAILAFAEDVMTSGLASSGLFGFAINVHDGLPEDIAEASYLGPTKRFPLLNPLDPGRLKFMLPDECGLAPIGAWYVLENNWAMENGLDPAKVANAVSDQVHSVTETPNGRLYKLWEKPILGDRHDGVDLSPAIAIGAALGPAMEAAYAIVGYEEEKGAHPLLFCSVGAQAERWNFYTRFLQMARAR